MCPRLSGLIVVIAALAAALAAPAWAQEMHIIPVPPHVQPQWTPVPENPRVAYAPNLPTDVFRYRGRYYLFWEGYWYRSGSLKGPWKLTAQVPSAISGIDISLFKQPQKPPAAAVPPSEEGGVPGGSQLPPESSTAPPGPAPEYPPPPPPPAAPGEKMPVPKVM